MPTDRRERSARLARWLLVPEAAALILASDVGLRLFGFRNLVRSLRRRPSRPANSARAARISEAVAIAGNLLGQTCLRRAFAGAWMMRRRGWAPTLHYGVSKSENGVIAHAWLDLDGHGVIGHEQASQFTLLASFPEQADATGETVVPIPFDNVVSRP